MRSNTPYCYWLQDSVLYTHVMASMAERLQTTTDYSTSQPHQQSLHSVLGNSRGNSTSIVSQHDVGGDRAVGPYAGVLPVPALPPFNQEVAHGDIHSGATGWHLRHVASSYSSYAFPDYLPAHNMGFSDTNSAESWLIPLMQESQHDPRHQFQEKDSHSRHVVNDDESESRVSRMSMCQWNDGYGVCGMTINTARVGEHMSLIHFKSPLLANSRLKCLWADCQLGKPVRRDTIIRHITEKHLGIRPRCRLWVASHSEADSRGSRKNSRRQHQ